MASDLTILATCQNLDCLYNSRSVCTMLAILQGNLWCDSFQGESEKPWRPSKWSHLGNMAISC